MQLYDLPIRAVGSIDTKINSSREKKANIKLNSSFSFYYSITKCKRICLKINNPIMPIGLAYAMRFKYDKK